MALDLGPKPRRQAGLSRDTDRLLTRGRSGKAPLAAKVVKKDRQGRYGLQDEQLGEEVEDLTRSPIDSDNPASPKDSEASFDSTSSFSGPPSSVDERLKQEEAEKEAARKNRLQDASKWAAGKRPRQSKTYGGKRQTMAGSQLRGTTKNLHEPNNTAANTMTSSNIRPTWGKAKSAPQKRPPSSSVSLSPSTPRKDSMGSKRRKGPLPYSSVQETTRRKSARRTDGEGNEVRASRDSHDGRNGGPTDKISVVGSSPYRNGSSPHTPHRRRSTLNLDTTPLNDSSPWVDSQHRHSQLSITNGRSPASSRSSPSPTFTCPMCDLEISSEFVRSYSVPLSRMNVRQKAAFCRAHKKNDAESRYTADQYPEIDWEKLEARLHEAIPHIDSILNGDTHSTFREDLESRLDTHGTRTMLQTLGTERIKDLTPGYYGTRGSRTIGNFATKTFAATLRKLAPKDRLISRAGGVGGYVQAVLVPELALWLIERDMDVDPERAKEILNVSKDIGNMVNDEVEDNSVTMLQEQQKEDIGMSQVDEMI